MNDITIVTAFFDIGRGEWTPDKGLPHYLQRTNDTYFERFSHMAKLENEMVVYTAPEFESRVRELRGDRKTEVVVIDFKYNFDYLRKRIHDAQKNENFQNAINPNQRANPEYWYPDYVLVNSLKSTFALQAIDNGYATNDLVAWLDFGYCRTPDALNGKTKWQYSFNKDKIHLFNLKEYDNIPIETIISNNSVYMTGPCIVAGRNQWQHLYGLVNHSMNNLLSNNWIDDDQTLLLMSYIAAPQLFELHKVSENDWFVAFKDYNESIS
jgi:protein YibB